MDPLPNINYIHVQAKTNAIIIVIYLINVLYTCVLDKRVEYDFSRLINEIWDYTNLFLKKKMLICITRINAT